VAGTERSEALADQIRRILAGSEFTPYDGGDYPREQFTVTAGVGVVIATAWRDATAEDRRVLLDRIESVLAWDFPGIEHRGDYLYVPEPQQGPGQ
jgi:hypothetical protein